jgi:hypothetical protein
MSQYNFEITIEGGQVRATYDWPDAEDEKTEPVDLVDDPLRLATVILLEQGLKRWEFIARLDTNALLLVPDTFEVLGRHLYDLILKNDIGVALNEAFERLPAGETLGVLISFGADAEKLAPLPWEFLYSPGTAGKGFFLATETRLVLSRCLPEPPRKEIRVADKRLKLLFVIALPDDDEFASERSGLLNLLGALGEGGDALEIISVPDLNEARLRESLRDNSIDIVHIVGVCRDDTPNPTILIQHNGTATWRDAGSVVSALTGEPATCPQLVVLHLCERASPPTLDKPFSESFERLAPMLVRAGIPAVLAMQYPMAREGAKRFLRQFYGELAKGEDIGRAVQRARSSMFDDEPGRRYFGTPVLYMQSVDGRLFGKATPVAAAKAAHGRQVAKSVRDIRQLVLDAIEEHAPDDEETINDVTAWANGIEWPDDRAEARRIIRRRWRDDQEPHRKSMYAALSRTVRQEE